MGDYATYCRFVQYLFFKHALEGKPLEQRIEIINATSIFEQPHCKQNADGTLSIFATNYDENGKYRCVCQTISELSNSVAVPLTYCGCCGGHIRYHFQNFLGAELRLVENVSSPISSNGEKCCEFRYEII